MGQHVVKYVNLTLLILYPISWFSPLMSAGLLPLFGMSEITIISGILTLWQDDPFLSLIVVLFAVLLPMGKTLCKASIDFGMAPKSWTFAALSRFAMADVFLIALYITAAKGIGVGRVETEWGLYLFTFCVLLSLLVSAMSSSALSRTSPSGRS